MTPHIGDFARLVLTDEEVMIININERMAYTIYTVRRKDMTTLNIMRVEFKLLGEK